MVRKRKDNPDAPPADPQAQAPDVALEDPGTPTPEPEAPEAPEAQASVTLRGPASSVRRAAARLGTQPAPARNGDEEEQEEEDTYNNKYAEMLADGRNMVIVTRDFPTRYGGQKVKPIKVKLNCPVNIDRLCSEIFDNYGGQVFRIAIYPNAPNAESKQPLGAFTLENPDTEEPWEPEDEGGSGGPMERFEDPGKIEREDRSVAAVTTKALEQEAAALAQELEVRRLKRLRKQTEDEDDGGKPDPSGDRVRALEERLSIRDVESRMEKRLEEVLKAVQERGPRGVDPVVEMMRQSNQQFMEMMKSQAEDRRQMFQLMMQGNNKKEDPFDHLEKLARLKTLFGGDNDRVTELYNIAIERLLDPDKEKGDESTDESDLKYAINKLEPLIQKFVDKKIEDSGKPKEQYTAEQIKQIQYEAAQKVAQELQAKWAAEGKILALPGPEGQPKPPGAPPAQPKPKPKESDMKPPPTPGQPGYDRKLAVNFVLDVTVEEIRLGRRDNSYLPWDIVDSLDAELLDEFSKVESGAQLDGILSKWGDPQKVEAVKELGRKDPLVKTWLSRVVATAQEFILKAKAEINKPAQ